MFELFVKLYVIIPLILVCVTVGLIIRGVKKKKRSAECEGEIIKLRITRNHMHSSDDPVNCVSPVVRYTVNGKDYEFIGCYGTTWMKVGDKMKVWYEIDNPSKASIKNGLFFAPIVTAIVALFSTIPWIVFVILLHNEIMLF